MVACGRVLHPVDALALVARHALGERALDLQLAEGVAGVVGLLALGVLVDDGLELGLGHDLELGEGWHSTCLHWLF